MAYWSLHGARMLCDRCGVECDRNSFSQIHCAACRRDVANQATREWKQRKRDEARAARAAKPIETIPCGSCGKTISRDHSQRRFCQPCRLERDLVKSRENTRKTRDRDPARHTAWARRAYGKRMAQPRFVIASRMSARIYEALKEEKAGRSWERLVGYSLAELVRHIERQFSRGMSWGNYGDWHIDHIRPVSSFVFSVPEDQEFRDCWALTNLRPLWAGANIQKSGKRLHLV